MEVKITTITPDMAKEWLANHNHNNRIISKQRVKEYADDIKSGKWNLTGQAITFGQDGELLDGQHRLAAIILADCDLQMLVCTDAPNAIYDRGRPRTILDAYTTNGTTIPGQFLSNKMLGAIRFTMSSATGVNTRVFSQNMIETAYEALSDGLRFISENLPYRKDIMSAPAYSAFLIAYYKSDISISELEKIAKSYCDGFAPTESLIWMVKAADEIKRIKTSGMLTQKKIYNIVAYAIFKAGTNQVNKQYKFNLAKCMWTFTAEELGIN